MQKTEAARIQKEKAATTALREASAKFAVAKDATNSDALRRDSAKAALQYLSDLSDKSDTSDYLSPADKRRIAALRSDIAKLAATLKLHFSTVQIDGSSSQWRKKAANALRESLIRALAAL